MATDSIVYTGQGDLYFGTWDSTSKALTDLKAVSVATQVLQVSLERTTEVIKESVSGNRLDYLEYATDQSANIQLDLQEFNPEVLAQAMFSVSSDVTGTSVTDEALPTVADGDIRYLRNPDVSNLVITDSAGTPATLALDTDYRIKDAKYGMIEILNTAGYTQPFKAAYDYASRTQLKPFSETNVIKGLLFNGVSTADNTRVQVIINRIAFSPTSSFDFIGNTAATLSLTGRLLLAEGVESNDATLGKFGIIKILS